MPNPMLQQSRDATFATLLLKDFLLFTDFHHMEDFLFAIRISIFKDTVSILSYLYVDSKAEFSFLKLVFNLGASKIK